MRALMLKYLAMMLAGALLPPANVFAETCEKDGAFFPRSVLDHDAVLDGLAPNRTFIGLRMTMSTIDRRYAAKRGRIISPDGSFDLNGFSKQTDVAVSRVPRSYPDAFYVVSYDEGRCVNRMFEVYHHSRREWILEQHDKKGNLVYSWFENIRSRFPHWSIDQIIDEKMIVYATELPNEKFLIPLNQRHLIPYLVPEQVKVMDLGSTWKGRIRQMLPGGDNTCEWRTIITFEDIIYFDQLDVCAFVDIAGAESVGERRDDDETYVGMTVGAAVDGASEQGFSVAAREKDDRVIIMENSATATLIFLFDYDGQGDIDRSIRIRDDKTKTSYPYRKPTAAPRESDNDGIDIHFLKQPCIIGHTVRSDLGTVVDNVNVCKF